MADYNSVEALVYRYAYAYDTRDLDGMGACYTPDAEFDWSIVEGPSGGPFVGRDAIVASNQASLAVQDDRRRHLMSNVVVTESGDTATATSYLALAVIAGGQLTIVATGRYSDRLVRSGKGWLFTSRSLVMDLPF